MPSLLSRHGQQRHGGSTSNTSSSSKSLRLTLLLFAASVLAHLRASHQHFLLISSLAWLTVWAYANVRVGIKSVFDAAPSQQLAWVAGTLWALAQMCERVVDGEDVWWAKGLVPLAIHLSVQSDALGGFQLQLPGLAPLSPDKEHGSTAPATRSKAALGVLTTSAVVAAFVVTGSDITIALGLSCVVIEALVYLLVDRASRMDIDHIAVIRDVSTAAFLFTTIALFVLERFQFGGLAYWGILGQAMGDSWLVGQGVLTFFLAIFTICIYVAMYGTTVLLIQQRDAFTASLVALSAGVCSQVVVSLSLSRLWFALLCGMSTFALLDDSDPHSSGIRRRIRFSRLLSLVTVLSLAVLWILHMQSSFHVPISGPLPPPSVHGLNITSPLNLFAPLEFGDNILHPVNQLLIDAGSSWHTRLQSQSQTLQAAVAEYKRRYSIPPPPNFDKWYEYAKHRDVQLIDEYDTIFHSLLPFWSLPPEITRSRAKEALGFGPNNLMGLSIRDGKAMHVDGGEEWLQQAVVGMIEKFVQFLPDMDLAFNIHDEPRVVVPHDELSRMVNLGLDARAAMAAHNVALRNSFSRRPADLGDGRRMPEMKTTRFNVFAHQPTWLPSRLSCSPTSPARSIDDSTADNLTAYALGELGFVYNQTAFSDVCNSPSFSSSHGFFDRPNAFNVVHDLFPIFSQSKMSSFQDILYPSPWYWYGKVAYDEDKDVKWDSKLARLYWRGSTTGGFSRDGGWRRQHRQKLVHRLNALDTAKILKNQSKLTPAGADHHPTPAWKTTEVNRTDFDHSIDVHFSHVGQCDPGDCDAQREFFSIAEPADQQDAWKFRHLLDMDGNAFSGRFYAFLKSHSLTYKMAVFREWHEEWIKPWVHYVPLSLRGEEALEAVRYFTEEAEGKNHAVRLAESGREWAGNALRNEDFETWFFRLLLEYGRIVDDHRMEIGYEGS